MEPRRLDSIAQGFVASSSRRLALLGLLGGLAATTSESQAKKRKKTCKKCKPQCAGKECGPNNCPNGTCGTCPEDTVCNILGQCVECRIGTDCAPEECNIANCVNEVCQYTEEPDEAPCDGGICCAGTCVLLPFCT
jgi:hypothetical protein